MRVPVRCVACGFLHRAELMDLPDGLLVCPLCEHEAKLPDESVLDGVERAEGRRRLLTALGAGSIALAISLAVVHVVLSESGAEGGGVTGALAGAGLLGILSLVFVVVQENRTTLNEF